MAMKTNFLQPGSYNAADIVAEFGALFTDGMLNGGAVTAHSPASLSVDVPALKCMKSGLFFISDATFNVTLAANTSGYNRIDVIAVDLDNTNIIAVQGTPSSSPTAPLLTGNKLAIAQVTVGNNVSVINQNVITDVRKNVDLFGSQLVDKASKAFTSDLGATLVSGWTGALSYAKNDLGQVWLRGSVVVGTKTMGTSIAGIPAAFLPSYTVPVFAFDTSGTVINGLAIYPAAGGLMIYHPADTSLVAGSTIHINCLYHV